ncbi:MAG: ECF transporter S component [Lachnospiraceae bacterium]|nr:ECF transporter S component [Lachnospiraceae bacterium]
MKNASTASGTKTGRQTTVKSLTITAIFIALTYVFTAMVNIRLPIAANGGLIHLGNIPLFIGAILFGRKTGFLAGGIGMGLFDLLSGWTIWAPCTFITVGLMGFVVGLIAERHRSFRWYTLAITLACVIKIAGYFIADVIIYHSAIVALNSIPGNLIQVGVAAVIVLAVITRLEIAARKVGLLNEDAERKACIS